ncbi:MAG: hypothetical protein ACOC55_01050, partial [Candidatus Natronoplasma sp.]
TVEEGQTVNFEWSAENYTAKVHVGQVSVYFNTTWGKKGLVRLHHSAEESKEQNETWKSSKTFENSGKIYFHFRVDKSDIARFYNRAAVIIEGDNVYEKVRTGPPPLIHFYFIPPTVLAPPAAVGGYFLSFYVYFSLFILLDSILLFYTFRRWDENKAFLSSLLFIANPISFYTLFQDEGIIAFTIILSLFLVIEGKKKIGALSIGLGSITKVWSGFLIPAQLFDRDCEFKKRFTHIIMSLVILSISLLSFYLVWGPKTLWFISFYGGSAAKSTLGGVSIWSYLSKTTLISESMIRSKVILTSIACFELFFLYKAYKKRWDMISVFTVTLAFFLLFYPKVHWEYYLMLLPTLLFYTVRHKKLFVSYIIFISCLTLARGVRDLSAYPDYLTLLMGFISSLAFTLIGLWIICQFLNENISTSYLPTEPSG